MSKIEAMLRGSVVPFAVQCERRGRQAGLAQGLEEGRKQIQSMHTRMARARFGAQVSERLAALLLPVGSLGLLGRVGDIVVAAKTGEELLARVDDLAGVEWTDGGFRA